MRDTIATILTAKFGLIIVLFFLPFLTFSCTPGIHVEISGFQLVTGDTITIEEPFTGQVQVEDLTGGGDHLQVSVVSEGFRGLSRIKQHQLIYKALRADLASEAIHALALNTTCPQ